MITRPSASAPRTTRFTSEASRAHARRRQIYPANRPRAVRQADLRIRSPLPPYTLCWSQNDELCAHADLSPERRAKEPSPISDKAATNQCHQGI